MIRILELDLRVGANFLGALARQDLSADLVELVIANENSLGSIDFQRNLVPGERILLDAVVAARRITALRISPVRVLGRNGPMTRTAASGLAVSSPSKVFP